MPFRPYMGACIPGIPPARTGKMYMKEVDHFFQTQYKKVYERLPFLTQEEVLRAKFPFHALLFRDLLANGYFSVVQELNAIVHIEQQQQKGRNLLLDDKKLILLSDTLKECEKFKNTDEKYIGTDLRKSLAETLIIDFNDVWLAIQFINSSLDACTINRHDPMFNRIEAEARCILACVAQGHPEHFDNATDVILNNLTRCRELSEIHNAWQFKSNVITFTISDPATFHGFRRTFDIIQASAMPLYTFSSILLQEVYFNISDSMIKNNRGFRLAKEWAEKALNIAKKVEHKIVHNTAILRFAKLLLNHGDINEALEFFQELQQHSILQLDILTEAVALNNMGICYDRQREILHALEQFDKQLDISEHRSSMNDTAGSALTEIGRILLSEGQLWEAEECYLKAHEHLLQSEQLNVDSSLLDTAWAMAGIAAGHNIWSRFAGLCRSDDHDSLERVIQWKVRRHPLPLVKRPDYLPDLIVDFYAPEKYHQFSLLDHKKGKVRFDNLSAKSSKRGSKPKYKDMLQEVESYEFASDLSKDDLLDYRAHSIHRFWSWARSLSTAIANRSTSDDTFIKEMIQSGKSRATFGDKETVRDVQFFDYDDD